MDLAYVAHAENCALLLNSEGICRWIVNKSGERTREAIAAENCVGAQFVATLDRDVEGLLGKEPAPGKTLLFAKINEGRVTLVRFGPIRAFDMVEGEGAPNDDDSPDTLLPLDAAAPTQRTDEDVRDALLARLTSAPEMTASVAPEVASAPAAVTTSVTPEVASAPAVTTSAAVTTSVTPEVASAPAAVTTSVTPEVTPLLAIASAPAPSAPAVTPSVAPPTTKDAARPLPPPRVPAFFSTPKPAQPPAPLAVKPQADSIPPLAMLVAEREKAVTEAASKAPPPPADSESLIDLSTGSFVALGSPGIASFLQEVAVLADSPYSSVMKAVAVAPPPSDIDNLQTGSFGSLSAPLGHAPVGVANDERARPRPPTLVMRDRATLERPRSLPPPLPAAAPTREVVEDPEIILTTGSFTLIEERELADLIENAQLEEPLRPSGFIRRTPDSHAHAHAHVHAHSHVHAHAHAHAHPSAPGSAMPSTVPMPPEFRVEETLRFARVEGGGITLR